MDVTYLDNAATSWPKPPEVGRAMCEFLDRHAGNPGRGGHSMARAAAEVVERVRARLGAMIGTDEPERVILTHGCTDAVNMSIHGVIRAAIMCPQTKRPRVVTTVTEHNAVLRTLACHAKCGEIELEIVPCDEFGRVDPGAFLDACTPDTLLACVTHASNVLGTIQPVSEIGRSLRERAPNALFLVDAAQTLGHIPVDVRTADIDLLAIAGHKGLLGPTGTGALYVGPRAFATDGSASRLFCDRRGGTGAVAPGLEMPETLPDALEAGTGNAVGLAGLEAAMDAAPENRHAHELALTRQMLERLDAIPGVQTYGPPGDAERMPVVLFNVAGVRSREIGARLDDESSICVRGGTHCAPMLHQAIGTGEDGGVRASPGFRTTQDDADRLIDAVTRLASQAATSRV